MVCSFGAPSLARLGRLSWLLAPVVAGRRFSGHLVRERAPETPCRGAQRVGLVKGARARIGTGWPLVDSDGLRGPQIARVAVGSGPGSRHDPRTPGDADVGRAGYRTGRGAGARRDALARVARAEDLDLDARIAVAALEHARASQLFTYPGGDLVAGHDVGDEGSNELHVESLRRSLPIDRSIPARGQGKRG